MAHDNFPTEASAVSAQLPHTLTLDDRAVLTLGGITDVVSFDETSALLMTSRGLLSLDGEEMHVTKLSVDDGGMVLEGRINAMVYLDSSSDRKNGRKSRHK